MSTLAMAMTGPVWSPRWRADAVTRDRWIGFGVAVAAHVLLFWVGGQWWVERAEYGVEEGSGGLAVHLVAALPSESPGAITTAATPPAPAMPEPEAVTEPEITAAPEAVALPAAAPAATPATTVARSPAGAVGDGSSPVPGADATTAYAPGGAWTSAQPRYLRNPAPAYPEAARRQGQAGVVLLAVDVDQAGRPSRVRVAEGSGFPLLDEAALQAVRRWRFQPARAGGVAVASTVDVPIVFRLE